MKRFLASIFIDFGLILEPSCPSKTEPRRSKIDVEITSKLDHFLKASWNASWGVGRASTDSDVVQRGTNVAKNPLQGAPGPPPAFGRIRAFGASWSKKWCFKRPPKTDQILIPFQHRFLSVLAPFWEAKMAPKSIKNRSKLSFRAFLFPHRF